MPRATYTLTMARRPRRDGSHTVTLNLRISGRRGPGSRKEFPVVIEGQVLTTDPDTWSKATGPRPRGEARTLADRLTAYQGKVNTVLADLGFRFSFDAFARRMEGRLADNTSLLHYLDQLAAMASKRSTREKFETTAKRIRDYIKAKDLQLDQVTVSWLEKFQRYYLEAYRSEYHGRSLSKASVNIDLRNIRKAYNEAIKAKAATRADYPFAEGGFMIRKTGRKNYSVLLRDIYRIEDYQTNSRPVAYARDMFVLTFYAAGANLADILRWKRSQVKDGYIAYQRHKTKGHENAPEIPVQVTPEIRAILDRWAWGSMYLFPDLDGSRTEDRRDELVNNATRRINKALKVIARDLGLPSLTLYWARKSYAVALTESGADWRTVRDALGHTSVTTTEQYTGLAKKEQLRQANEALRRTVREGGEQASDA